MQDSPRGGRAKRPTLADVARLAGVSVQTASHVISESPHARISEPTKQRIREAAAQLGYRPNRLAQAMKYGRTNVIALWVPAERFNTTIAEFIIAFTKKARESSLDLVIIGLENDLAYGRTWRMPLNWPVDGIIALDCGRAVKQFAEKSGDSSTPFCIIGNELVANSDNVVWDAVGSVESFIEERLTALKTNNAWHMGLEWILNDYPDEQRRRGFNQAVQQAGGEPREVAIAEDSKAQIFERLGAAHEEFGAPRLIFAATGYLAVQAALWVESIHMGDQIEVLGYGSCHDSQFSPCPLSILEIPIHDVVEQAWDYLQSRIASEDIEPRSAVFAMTRKNCG